MTNLTDVKKFTLRTFDEPDGSLTPIEFGTDIPFKSKRIFYVYGVQDQNDRGKHAHHKTKQVLICLSGRVDVICDDGEKRERYMLCEPNDAIYIPEMIWDEQIYVGKNSVLLVIANTNYNKDDYIEDYEEFLKLKGSD